MIYEKLENINSILGLIKKEDPLYEALNAIKEGRLIKNENVFVNEVEFNTLKEAEKRYEAHKKYYDIHVINEGEELCKVCDISDLQNESEYVDDIYFGDCKNEKALIKLTKGDILILFENDAHKIGFNNKTSHVKKLVYKVKIFKG